MNRRTAREDAVKLIYEMEMGGDGGEDTRFGVLEIDPNEEEADYVERLYQGVTENVDQIDAILSDHLTGWTIERISKVDLAVLRGAAYELKYVGLPASVVINEAVEIVDRYSTDKARAFVNGVLGALSRAEK
ncbi:MAG: transcription antitermination factor NusB [Clostridia bacterium]|nr:transcription antitermination factor NusB [Clostridia bacterium]